ncbi:phage holin family protein [Jonesia denitrificans]|uniref:Toxin secretion/phage lysis holin n=1 Tax=Jonesia denitrificans (strain ATCC 14870 / DSM 20603 / BCRC 15368 / CIP 55.134 / JCM 11481 / NBRC 15587 / NCTC 10816 / Prevot 55134) TaxID=471856 RepID=C7R0F1_JONDD|nr:phage holin family protein [Jonesia denitrificans]ACV09615.1 toxin secretion/phage lysis holin [Jonesia denitrificans DSM 20603]ASE09161.1 holin [Jonesia denitrificans]QXB43705.1 phage holin family protein [Jonesia denitrificans]SQH22086.1 Phage-related holin (Lysis protein) [Jonesia denitrificans]
MGTDTILGSTDLVMSGVGGWFGGFDGLFHALVAFVVADYVSGVLAAVSERRLSSSAGFRGISRKILIFTFVCFAHVLDAYALGGSGVLRTATIFFYISNEGISLIENATRLGLPVPA